MSDNPYKPGTIYEGESHTRSANWWIRSSVASFVLAIIFIVAAEVCLQGSLVEPASFEERLRMATLPAKAAAASCLLGFVLLIAGLMFRRRGEVAEE